MYSDLVFEKGKYSNNSEEEIRKDISKLGFFPLRITNTKGYTYSEHIHPETKLLVFISGSMDVSIGDKNYSCEKGDLLIIPGNTPHSAEVTGKVCEFFWSES